MGKDDQRRAALCLLACAGIPDRYLERGYPGLTEWVLKQHKPDITPDTWLPLKELRRYLPNPREKRQILRWAAQGRRRVRLRTEQRDGRLCSTLFEYFVMQARLSPHGTQEIKRNADGSALHVVACIACTRVKRIQAKEGDSPACLLIDGGWKHAQDGWRCLECR